MEDSATTQSAEPQKSVVLAVGVEFHRAGKVYTFTTTEQSLKSGDAVVVEAEGGTSVGFVVAPPHEAREGELLPNAKRLLRKASGEEMNREAERREQALKFFSICNEKIRERGLLMKLVDVTIEEDGKKAAFVFFAEQRVDFRGLVKDLAGALHMRIEMRQIGARDESRYKGCLGPCGLTTCCSSYLRQFQSISISMAKHQGLAPNPAKLTGMCGKLKCCLAYEHAVYNEYRTGLPKLGSAVSSPHGAGKVTSHNILKRECAVKLFGGGEVRCSCDACKPMTQQEREAAIEAVRRAEESGEERARLRRERRGNSSDNRGKKRK